MSNNPVSFVDPDGGWDEWYDRNSVSYFVDGIEVDAAEFRGYRGGSIIGDLLYDVQGGPFGGTWFGSLTGNIIARAVELWSQHIDPHGIFSDEWRFHGFVDPDGLNGTTRENLYVLIRNKQDISDFYINSKKELGTFNIIISNNMIDAVTQVKGLLGDKKLKTLVIDSHGIESGGSMVVKANEANTLDLAVSGDWLSFYLTSKEEAQKQNPEIFPYFEAIETMMSFLDADSKCVFMTCNLAKGDDGGLFMDAVSLMVFPTSSQIYFNNDYSKPMNADSKKKELQIWQGEYGISKEYLKHGWVKVHVTDTVPKRIEILKGNNGRTGDIYLDNREKSLKTVHEKIKN
jgi:hypothetical protein